MQNEVNRAVERGLSGENRNASMNWYNTEPLRERFGDLYRGPGSSDDAYLRFMQAVGTTSPQNTVMNNVSEATKIMKMLAQGKEIPRSGKEAGFSGVAADTRAILSRKKFGQEGGYNVKDSQKTEHFGRSLAGDQSKAVVDAHAMRTLSMAQKDPRYLTNSIRYQADHGGYENYSPRDLLANGETSMKELLTRPTMWMSAPTDAAYGLAAKPYHKAADKFGLAPGQAQAAAWYGNADKTGVKTTPHTFNELFEQRLRENALAMNKSPEELLDDVINGRAHLDMSGVPMPTQLPFTRDEQID